VTLSDRRRRDLIQRADRYGTPIIEDDPYGELRYEGDHLTPLVVLDANRLNDAPQENGEGYFRGNVIYMSTFSKTLAPGLRMGWIVAPVSVIQRCVMAKQGMDLHSSTFIQMVSYDVAKDGFLEEHVKEIRDVYRHRRDVMLNGMERHFPSAVRWTRPQGGLFLWAVLPDHIDAADVLEKAVENKVAFVPGTAFYPDGGGHNTMRLNFSNARPDQIEIGIERLGEVLTEILEEESSPESMLV
jgi:2-aminoadipate transaminase